MLDDFQTPEFFWPLIAILVLLVIWQYYKMQIMAGRILAVDIFDRSGIRMYVYALANDGQTCPTCSAINGRVFLPSSVAKRGFSPLESACSKPKPCAGVLVGLYGGWPEARHALERLRQDQKKGWVTLSQSEFRGLLDGPWERSISAESDRLSMYMLIALTDENHKQELAIGHYGYIIEHAKDVHHHSLLVPAYHQVTQLLVKAGRWGEALKMIEHFDARYPQTDSGPYSPSAQQREEMKRLKTHVLKNQLMKLSA